MDAAGRKAAANFIPEKRRNFVADDAIENAAGLLGVHEIGVYFSRVLKGGADRFGRNFIERDAEDFLRIYGNKFFLRFVLRLFFHHLGLGVLFLEARDGGFLLGIF